MSIVSRVLRSIAKWSVSGGGPLTFGTILPRDPNTVLTSTYYARRVTPAVLALLDEILVGASMNDPSQRALVATAARQLLSSGQGLTQLQPLFRSFGLDELSSSCLTSELSERVSAAVAQATFGPFDLSRANGSAKLDTGAERLKAHVGKARSIEKP